MTIAQILNGCLPHRIRPAELAATYYVRWSRGIVQGGPFRGLRYTDQAFYSALPPKIAGSYEKELHPYLERIRRLQPDVLIDVGAAEGYYAVGALHAGWTDRVVAFESSAEARTLLGRLAALNGIDPRRLSVCGACTTDNLDQALAAAIRPVIIMDIEGFEALVLDPLRVKHLARCHILVEYHDFVLPGLSEQLRQRLAGTHDVEVIAQCARSLADLPCSDPWFAWLPGAVKVRVLRENRPLRDHGWLWLAPRHL